MSVKVMTMVWGAEFETTTHKLVALKLADCANDKGESIYPSVATIARATGVTPRSVQRVLADLRKLGLLAIQRRGGGKSATRYRMKLPWLRERQTPDVDVTGDADVTPP